MDDKTIGRTPEDLASLNAADPIDLNSPTWKREHAHLIREKKELRERLERERVKEEARQRRHAEFLARNKSS